MAFSQTVAAGVTCLVALMVSGCYDLAKSRASWSSSYVAAMSPEQMTEHARAAFRAAGAPEERYMAIQRDAVPGGTHIRGESVKYSPTWSLTMAWRRGVWLVTGVPACIVLALPTATLSLHVLFNGPITFGGAPDSPQSNGEALARNTASYEFFATEIIPGLSIGMCKIECMGMVSDSRRVKNALWRELGSRFPQDGLLEWVPPERWPVPPAPRAARFPSRAPKPVRSNQEPLLSK